MGDVDLLVRADQAIEACRLVRTWGYGALPGRPPNASRWEREGDDAWYRRLRHAEGFHRGPQALVDVHWALSLDFIAADPALADTTGVFERARDAKVGDAVVRTLSPTDHLFHAIVHGLGTSPSALLRWVPDALAVLQRGGEEIDWDVLIAEAAARGCSLTLSDGLGYLATNFDGPVPVQVLGRLAGAPVGGRQRAVRWIRRGSARRWLGSGYAASLYVTSTAGLGPVQTIARAPGFLVDFWNLERGWELPLVVAHKLRQGPEQHDAARDDRR
jgi:hypothetical protein